MKKYILTLIFSLAVLFISNSASANSYTHTCDDGGTVTSVVNIVPTGPFSTTSSTLFSATGYLSSTCGARNMTLTASNNSGIVATLIPQTLVSPTPQFPVPAATTAFSSPTIAGTYNVHFETGVDEPVPVIQNYAYTTNIGAIMGICRLMPSGSGGYFTATRDANSEASATARGVIRVEASIPITTDNEHGYVTSVATVNFYPGDLEVAVPEFAGGVNHDSGGYCSSWVNQDGYGQITLQEYF